jgi:hypothetical protein
MDNLRFSKQIFIRFRSSFGSRVIMFVVLLHALRIIFLFALKIKSLIVFLLQKSVLAIHRKSQSLISSSGFRLLHGGSLASLQWPKVVIGKKKIALRIRNLWFGGGRKFFWAALHVYLDWWLEYLQRLKQALKSLDRFCMTNHHPFLSLFIQQTLIRLDGVLD